MRTLKIKTNDREEIIDITSRIKDSIKGNQGKACLVYVKHTTAAVVINENDDPAVKEDILHALREIVPKNNGWRHKCDKDNADAHVRASLLGPSKFIPMREGALDLGIWQGIFLVELDGPREREVVVEVL